MTQPSMFPHHLLLLEDNPPDTRLILNQLPEGQFEVTVVTTLEAAHHELSKRDFSVVLADLNQEKNSRVDTLGSLLRREIQSPVVILSSADDRSEALEAIKSGAQDYLPKAELTPERLERTLNFAIERTQATKRLKTSLEEIAAMRDQLQNILAALGDGLLVTNLQGGIELANPAAVRLLAPTSGMLTEALLPTELKKQIQNCLTNQSFERHEFPLALPSLDSNRIIKVSLSSFYGQGIIALLQDVSNEQRFEQLKRQFIGITAHELRTPLTAILGFSELLLYQTELSENERTSYQKIIQKNAEALQGITDQLLDISLVEAGWQLPLDTTTFDLPLAIQSLVEDLQINWPRHQIKTSLNPPRLTICADHERICRVIRQIIINALKFSPLPSPVTVTGERTAAGYRLSIQDQGIGMSLEQQRGVFKPFYRVDGTDTAKGGMGIGLAQAKSVLEAHQGSITLESAPGKGTTVTLLLPTSVIAF